MFWVAVLSGDPVLAKLGVCSHCFFSWVATDCLPRTINTTEALLRCIFQHARTPELFVMCWNWHLVIRYWRWVSSKRILSLSADLHLCQMYFLRLLACLLKSSCNLATRFQRHLTVASKDCWNYNVDIIISHSRTQAKSNLYEQALNIYKCIYIMYTYMVQDMSDALKRHAKPRIFLPSECIELSVLCSLL